MHGLFGQSRRIRLPLTVSHLHWLVNVLSFQQFTRNNWVRLHANQVLITSRSRLHIHHSNRRKGHRIRQAFSLLTKVSLKKYLCNHQYHPNTAVSDIGKPILKSSMSQAFFECRDCTYRTLCNSTSPNLPRLCNLLTPYPINFESFTYPRRRCIRYPAGEPKGRRESRDRHGRTLRNAGMPASNCRCSFRGKRGVSAISPPCSNLWYWPTSISRHPACRQQSRTKNRAHRTF
jgi:hypothetical protein